MIEKIGEKNINYKKTIIFIFIIAMFLTLISFAVSDVSIKYIEENGVQYIFFKLDHNLANTAYKYFGYGYHVTVYDNDNRKIGYKFLTNAEFKPDMIGGVETVKIPIEELYYKTDVENKYFYRQDCTIWLNGRLGIKVNGVLKFLYDSLEGTPETGLDSLPTGYATFDGQTVPLNKDGKGIRDGIKHEYGVDWSLTTQINLQQHFGIDFRLDPIFKYDGYEVLYKEVSTGKTVSSQKELQNFNEARTITEYPETVNGYEYSGYYEIKKVDNRGRLVEPPPKPVTQGDSATVNLSQTASIYTIVFYYNKVDPSTIGKPVTIEIEHRKNTSTGKELISKKTIISAERALFNLNSEKIDDYSCKGHYVMGQETEHFYNVRASFTIGKEQYNTPVDKKLKIIFLYEKEEKPVIKKCEPEIYGNYEPINLNMKKKDFEDVNTKDIQVNNAVFYLDKDDLTFGLDKDFKPVEGTHEFHHFDFYILNQNSYDNKTTKIQHSFTVPKSSFTKVNDNLYTATVDVIYAGHCSCIGMNAYFDTINININLIENKAPVAYFRYYTEKKLENGNTDEIYKTYIGYETIIDNLAFDPNGNKDIKKINYYLKDSNNNQYFINLLMVGNGVYFLDNDNLTADNIIFNGITDTGSLKLKFLTEEKWTISQYVEDMDGLNDTYTKEITPEVLDLRPKAIISDATGYRYPIGRAFNGKQNRVVKYHSNNSYVADFLSGTGVTINHNRDCWQIIPLDGQSIDSIGFENKTGLYFIETDENIINIKYSTLNNTKLQFKEAGKYKIRLQVSDINGNVSEWAEKIVIINEDLKPQVTANINKTYVRNAKGVATIIIKNISPKSIDGDYVIMEGTNKIKYKYDSNNNGSFDDEIAQDLALTNKGSSYEATLITSNLGKYQFIVNVSETFGQEYLEEFITENDYKKAGATLQTHIDNINPDVTSFKIMTTENE